MFLINFSSANQIELIGNSDNIIQINDDFLLNLKVKLPDNISKNDFNFYLLIKKDGKLLDKIDNLNIILNKDNLISLDYSFDKKGIYIIEWNLENSKEKYKFEEIIVMFDNISLINELDLEKLNNYIEKNEFFQDFDESDIFLIDNLLSEISNTNYKEKYADWPPAGPNWRQNIDEEYVQGIVGATIATENPEKLSKLWSEVLDSKLLVENNCPSIVLENANITFVQAKSDYTDLVGIKIKASQKRLNIGQNIKMLGLDINFI